MKTKSLALGCLILIVSPFIVLLIFIILVQTGLYKMRTWEDHVPLSITKLVATNNYYSSEFTPEYCGEHILAISIKDLKIVSERMVNLIAYTDIQLEYSDGTSQEFLVKFESDYKWYFRPYYFYYFIAIFNVQKKDANVKCKGKYSVRFVGDLSSLVCNELDSSLHIFYSERK